LRVSRIGARGRIRVIDQARPPQCVRPCEPSGFCGQDSTPSLSSLSVPNAQNAGPAEPSGLSAGLTWTTRAGSWASRKSKISLRTSRRPLVRRRCPSGVPPAAWRSGPNKSLRAACVVSSTTMAQGATPRLLAAPDPPGDHPGQPLGRPPGLHEQPPAPRAPLDPPPDPQPLPDDHPPIRHAPPFWSASDMLPPRRRTPNRDNSWHWLPW
jgi:hypothetical protein